MKSERAHLRREVARMPASFYGTSTMAVLPIAVAIAQLSMCALLYALFKQELLDQLDDIRARLRRSS